MEAVGIATACQRREENPHGSRSEPSWVNAPMVRRPVPLLAEIKCPPPGGHFVICMVEAVGIEPTSEELRSPVSPCAAGCCISPGGRSAGSLPRGPARFISVAAFGRDGDPARQTSSIPDRRAGPREGRGYLRSQCVVVIGSCVCLHPFYERMALDTLPTTETVPRRTQYAPRFDYYRDSTTKAPCKSPFPGPKIGEPSGE